MSDAELAPWGSGLQAGWRGQPFNFLGVQTTDAAALVDQDGDGTGPTTLMVITDVQVCFQGPPLETPWFFKLWDIAGGTTPILAFERTSGVKGLDSYTWHGVIVIALGDNCHVQIGTEDGITPAWYGCQVNGLLCPVYNPGSF